MQHIFRHYYLSDMDSHYATLRVLCQAVQDLANPTGYLCSPREMILRSDKDWAVIYNDLRLLAEEKLVVFAGTDNVQFSVTEAGIKKDASISQSKVNHSAL